MLAGEVLVINPNEPIDLTYSEDCEKFIVRVSAKLFEQACTEHCRLKPGERVKFNPVSYKLDALAGFAKLIELMCAEAESETATPQLLQHYGRVVASKLIALLQHNVDLTTPSVRSLSFERILRYIDENIKCDISPEDLAKHANVSVRAVYTLFEKYAQTTPRNFVRQKKLECVYSALMNSTSDVVHVTTVALDYGFSHLGRFSECYKATFGELPSETLKARRLNFNTRHALPVERIDDARAHL